MSTSSITSTGAAEREPVSGPAIGQLVLLGSMGVIEQSWDIPLGRWTLGSDPQSHLHVADSANIQPLHITLNVGEKYTFLKAFGPLKVAGRAVRECLLDKSSSFECGDRKFTLYLHERSPSPSVLLDRILDVASDSPSSEIIEAAETVTDSQLMDARVAQLIIANRVAAQAVAAQPVAAQPVATQPVATQPVATQPVATQPVATQPVAPQPVAPQPVAPQPVAAQPVAAQPVAAQPVAAQPVAAQLVAAQPVTAEAVDVQAVVSSPVEYQAEAELVAMDSGEAEADAAQSIVAPLWDEMNELRDAIHTIQERFAAFPEPEALDQRIEEYTDKAINAIEEDLSQRIREPLRNELTTWYHVQRQQSEAAVQKRIDSLELRLRQLAEQWAIEVEATKSEIVHFRRQIQGLFEAQTSFRGPGDGYIAEQQENPIPFSEDGEAPIAFEAEPVPQDFEEIAPSEWNDSELEPPSAKAYSEEPQQESSSLPDDAIEFEVDDESISLRLSRMLGSPVDRRSPHEEEAEPQAREVGLDLDPYAGMNDELPADLLDEPDAIRLRMESEENAIEVVDRDIDDPSDAIEIPASEWKIKRDEDYSSELEAEHVEPPSKSGSESGDEPEEGSEEGSAEESIEDYMQRLLQRVRTGPGNESAIVPKSQSPRTSDGVTDGVRKSSVSGPKTSTVPRKPTRESAPLPPPKPISEAKTELQALRELANSNARRAIDRSMNRRQGSNVFGKASVAGIGAISAIVLFFLSDVATGLRFGGIAICLLVAIVWGIDAVRENRSMRKRRGSRDSDGDE
ncbi:MAG: hypothetical protein ACK553_11565 [Planctomycetota bacterium]